jgi:putative Ca2+/H+ antiporter (TMEM165/GDT1 family)
MNILNIPEVTQLSTSLIDTSSVALVAVTNNFINATINSLMMILVTEIGDKTFFIAAVLAMRNGRLIVYAGAMGNIFVNLRCLQFPINIYFFIGALAVMHVLSSIMGFALPSLLPRIYTHYASAVSLFYSTMFIS